AIEDAQLVQLAGHGRDGLVDVVAVNAEQHQQAGPDLADGRAVDAHGGAGDPGDDGFHGCVIGSGATSTPCRTSSRTAGSAAATIASTGRSCANASSSTSSASGSSPRQPASSAAAGSSPSRGHPGP